MFDSETVRIIQGAVAFEDLDLERLPQFLTEAYAKVVAARLGAVDFASGQRDDGWTQNLDQLRRLADTYEGLTIFLPDSSPHRASCAFVSASAHHTLGQARKIEAQADGVAVHGPSLTTHGVAPEVAACLLFLLAGQQADAAETTKLFKADADRPHEAELLRGLAALASGDGRQLEEFAADTSPAPVDVASADYIERAAATLWKALARAVRLIGRIALGLDVNEQAEDVIEAVLATLRSSQITVTAGDLHLAVRPSLSGPYHFARLLRRVSSELLGAAIVHVGPPSGVDQAQWAQFIRFFAASRPFLWRNHLSALAEGFLNSGRSFVLTFPTGAGKTTVTELRIAAELLRGRKVVYLAPTRALVDQVAQQISERLDPIVDSVVRGRFLEDFGEDAAGRVFVQTPEQCLAYLSFDVDAHRDLGLIVVDEAHQISGALPAADGSTGLPGRREVDAMWALLSLMQRSPNADVVLISAMVRNGRQLADWLSAATQRPASILELPWKPTRQVRGVVVYEASEVRGLEATLAVRRNLRQGGKPRTADKTGAKALPIGLFCHTQVWATNSSFAKFPVLPGPVSLGVNDFWSVTANRNEVGGHLLASMARAKMRPIVFSQQIGWTTNIANLGAKLLDLAGVPVVDLSDDETRLFAAAAVELGGSAHVEGICDGRIGVHHGLLLWPERLAVESAFRRLNGLHGLVATPTVAQGINLPAEAVVIAGDDRWTGEMEEGGMQPLAVHELLNAAGRAGRAGHYAHGIVVDLPGRILTVEDAQGGYAITHLDHIMSLFGLPDQCLDIVDPITQVIDRIQSGGVQADICEDVVRLASGIPEDQLVRILGAAFGNAATAGSADRAAAQAMLLRSRGLALDVEQAEADNLDLEAWREFAGQVGVSPLVAARIAARVPAAAAIAGWDFDDLIGFAIGEVTQQLFGLVNPAYAGLTRILPRTRTSRGQSYDYTETVLQWEQRWRDIIPELIHSWTAGADISTIGQFLHTHRRATGHVNPIHLGRRFAVHSAASIAHGASVAVRILELTRGDTMSTVLRSQVQLVSGCLREGFDDPDKLLLFWHLRRFVGRYPRVAVHAEFSALQGWLGDWDEETTVDSRRNQIRRAWEI